MDSYCNLVPIITDVMQEARDVTCNFSIVVYLMWIFTDNNRQFGVVAWASSDIIVP